VGAPAAVHRAARLRGTQTGGTPHTNTVTVHRIEPHTQRARGVKVIIEVDFAELYGVPTKRLNEQVKRNL
jgi:hypothetical protein